MSERKTGMIMIRHGFSRVGDVDGAELAQGVKVEKSSSSGHASRENDSRARSGLVKPVDKK
jgi:hypothetical protein